MTQTALQVFTYNAHQVRTTEVDGEVWFVAIDVANVLELTNVTEALRGLDEEERSTLRITEGTSPKGGNPNMNVISEAGLYKLIFNSRKPEAKAFTHWVTHEVLPKIRKTENYSALEAVEIPLTEPSKKQLLKPTEIGSHFDLKAHRVSEILRVFEELQIA